MNQIKIKTIILDDESRGVKIIEMFLSTFVEIEVIASLTYPEEAIAIINKLSPDLLILDVQMPKYNGFEVLERINVPDLKVIFVTAHSEFAIKAFKYSAVDYLLKPIDEETFGLTIRKVIDHIKEKNIFGDIKTLVQNVAALKNSTKMSLCISNVNGFTIIKTDDIIYCEADSCYTIFRLIDGKQIVSSKTLSEYESILDEANFLRIHRSYIINTAYIKEYKKGSGGHVIMSNGDELEVSRRKKDEFMIKVRQMFNL